MKGHIAPRIRKHPRMSAEEKHDVLVEERFLVVLLVHGRCSSWRARAAVVQHRNRQHAAEKFIDTGG